MSEALASLRLQVPSVGFFAQRSAKTGVDVGGVLHFGDINSARQIEKEACRGKSAFLWQGPTPDRVRFRLVEYLRPDASRFVETFVDTLPVSLGKMSNSTENVSHEAAMAFRTNVRTTFQDGFGHCQVPLLSFREQR